MFGKVKGKSKSKSCSQHLKEVNRTSIVFGEARSRDHFILACSLSAAFDAFLLVLFPSHSDTKISYVWSFLLICGALDSLAWPGWSLTLPMSESTPPRPIRPWLGPYMQTCSSIYAIQGGLGVISTTFQADFSHESNPSIGMDSGKIWMWTESTYPARKTRAPG